MRALDLDYGSARRRPAWADMALLLAGLTVAGVATTRSVDLFSRLGALQAEQAAVDRAHSQHHATRHLSAIEQAQLREEIKQANEVLGMLTLPWDALFVDIEASQQPQVALLAITPDADKRTVRITAEAKDFSAMLGYLRQLQKRHSLLGVYLESHHIQQQTAERPVRFVVAAAWAVSS